jgi:hypothetical protein
MDTMPLEVWSAFVAIAAGGFLILLGYIIASRAPGDQCAIARRPLGGAQAQTSWMHGNITYRTHGNMIYGSDGSVARRVGDTVTLITPPSPHPERYHGVTVCRTYADRIVCN